MSLATKLKELRVRQKQSLQDVADAVGASKTHIWDLETGRSSNPSVDLLTSTISYHFYLDRARALGEIRRVLRPGGQLLLATLATHLLRGNLRYMRLATISDTRADLAAAGFTVERVVHVFPAVRVFVATAAGSSGNR